MKRLKQATLQWAFDRYYGWRYQEFLRTPQVIALDYKVQPRARYGYGGPPHQAVASLLDRRRCEYGRLLDRLCAFRSDFAAILLDPDPQQPYEPSWRNPYFPLLDASALYGFIADQRPTLYVEIGSGHSTRFARRAIRSHHTATAVISIDPNPRLKVDALADEVIPVPLGDADLSLFDRLSAGDILFLDASHRLFQNSDVCIFFLEILPRLVPGVLVHLHDIFLPYDYPPVWFQRYYSEQYVLGVALITSGTPGLLHPLLPNAYISHDPELRNRAQRIWEGLPVELVATERAQTGEMLGTSFWALSTGATQTRRSLRHGSAAEHDALK